MKRLPLSPFNTKVMVPTLKEPIRKKRPRLFTFIVMKILTPCSRMLAHWDWFRLLDSRTSLLYFAERTLNLKRALFSDFLVVESKSYRRLDQNSGGS